jgi:hypothetical protein
MIFSVQFIMGCEVSIHILFYALHFEQIYLGSSLLTFSVFGLFLDLFYLHVILLMKLNFKNVGNMIYSPCLSLMNDVRYHVEYPS